MTPILYISDPHNLASFCRRLREHDRIAVDTEFVGETSFVPRLELIQVASDGLSAIIDFPAVSGSGEMKSFWDVICDERIEKVIHSGRQDLELFYTHAGRLPARIFDTQPAAAMVGYGTQVAYAQLVHRVLGIKLEKSSTLTNWSQRPLTDDQLSYALEDVQYLLPVSEHLRKRLESLGRLDWLREELSRLERKLSDGSRDPRCRYQRIRGWENLKPRAVAVLRELVAWREEEARGRNVPRGRVMRDEVLLELARRPPGTLAALRTTRGVHHAEVDRNGEKILEAIRCGLNLPESEWPEVPRGKRPEPEAAGQVDLLQAVLKARAEEMEIAPSLLASAADLQTLVDAKDGRDTLDVPILHGWRRKLAGEILFRVLDGKIAVRLDRQTGKLRLEE